MELTGQHVKLQNAATTGNGTAVPLNGQGREVSVYIYGAGTVSAGAVQLEEAHDPAYTGTWSPIGSPITVVSNTVAAVHATGCLGAIRARVSTDVTGGGSVTVDLFTN